MKSMVELSHDFLKGVIHPQALLIDATLGQGKDTLFFMQQHAGSIHAFEIDEEIVKETSAFLQEQKQLMKEKEPFRKQSEVCIHPCSHDQMEKILSEEKKQADGIIFNFGWYPKEAGRSETLPQTSAKAVEQALSLLRPKGRMALVFYDHEQARQEQEAVLDVLEKYKNEFEIYTFEKMYSHGAPKLCLISHKSGQRV